MKKQFILFGLSLFLLSLNASGQEYRNSLSAEFGPNMHGTGDIKGIQYGLRYNRFLNKRFDLIVAFEANLNDSPGELYIWEDPEGNEYDGTLHNVIAGIQLNVGIGFNIINSDRHKFGLNPSIFIRYQANSLFNTTVIDFPTLTGYPVPIRTLLRDEPGNTYAAGGSLRLFYNYKINSKYFLGINPGFQTDSEEDTILFGTLSFGINL